jgi:3-deoxy-7-phosphoheptulonate synthase
VSKESFRNVWSVIAGPCSAETRSQVLQTADELSTLDIDYFRAGIWKPRTNPESWQGPGVEALEWLKEAKRTSGVAIATEVNDTNTIELTLKSDIDLIWVGSRNAQCYPLLEEVGKLTSSSKLPVLLKRGMGSDLCEWLGAAEYIQKYNENVILCERGIKGFPRDTRNVLDIQTAKLAQIQSGLPVVIDVSHASGRQDLVIPMALAAKAAGFDGLMVEVHPFPDEALTDSKQQISTKNFARLQQLLKQIPDMRKL